MWSLIPFCRVGILILAKVHHLWFVCVVGVCAALAYAFSLVVVVVGSGAGNVILDVAVVVEAAAVYSIVGVVHVPHSCPWFHTVACH